jgi:8-oxo-dGTP pyrophosphatase MutT (NUDIX family)
VSDAPAAGPATADEEFDPLAVPVRPAATVMVVEDQPLRATDTGGPAPSELRVLMLRRTARAIFAGDMWVYPGGRVDPEDEAIAAQHVVGLEPEEANRRLGVDEGGLSFWVAALRECFEEAGILLARRRLDGLPVDVTAPATVERLARRRAALNRGEITFAEVIAEEDVELDAARIHYVAHWVTPLGSPRRFDTRFFVAAAPPGQVAAHDDNEVVHHEWVRPTTAVEAWKADRMAMMTPTARMLMCLAPFASAAEVMAAAGLDLDPAQIRVLRVADEYRIMLPGEPGWADGDPDAEFGWVKLRRP